MPQVITERGPRSGDAGYPLVPTATGQYRPKATVTGLGTVSVTFS